MTSVTLSILSLLREIPASEKIYQAKLSFSLKRERVYSYFVAEIQFCKCAIQRMQSGSSSFDVCVYVCQHVLASYRYQSDCICMFLIESSATVFNENRYSLMGINCATKTALLFIEIFRHIAWAWPFCAQPQSDDVHTLLHAHRTAQFVLLAFCPCKR